MNKLINLLVVLRLFCTNYFGKNNYPTRTVMKLMKLLLAAVLGVGLVGTALPQADFGNGNLSAIEKTSDYTINLLNLSVMVNVPIRQKSAGAIPFSYAITQSSAYTVEDAALLPLAPAPIYGLLSAQAEPGRVVTSTCGSGNTTILEDFVVSSSSVTSEIDGGGRVDSQGCFSTGFTLTAIDGTGLTLTVSRINTTTYSWSVADPSGNVLSGAAPFELAKA